MSEEQDKPAVKDIEHTTVLECLELAMTVASKHKPMDHSSVDRIYAIMITEITKSIAFAGYFKL